MRCLPGSAHLTALTLLTLALVGPGCAPESVAPLSAVQRTDPVIYGDDDRLDVYAHPDQAWRDRARRSIVAMVSADAVQVQGDRITLRSNGTLGQSRRLCESERFRDQPVVADCSGTLVGDDLVITAGHCVNAGNCDGIRFVFDYFYEAPGRLATVTADDVYACSEVLAWALDETDIALVQLDRPVVGDRAPAEVRWAAERLPRDAPLVMMGFPSGLPTKIEDGGRVVNPGAANVVRFSATVDAYGGNSGSGVFSAEDGRMVGVLVAGAEDYVREGNCAVSNRLPEDVPEGESLIYVHRARALLCEGRPGHPLCRGDDGWCATCGRDGDCPDGWGCRREGVCSPACAAADDCRFDHVCERGACRPRVTPYCRGGDAWLRDACGVADARADICGPDQRCVEGACEAAPPGETCESAVEIPARDAVYEVDLRDYEDDGAGQCVGQGPDRWLRFTLEVPTAVTLRAEGGDPGLHLHAGCGPRSEIACNDDDGQSVASALRVLLEPGEYTVAHDSFGEGSPGRLQAVFEPVIPDPDRGVPDVGPRDAEVDAFERDAFVGPERDAFEPPDAAIDFDASGWGNDAAPPWRPDAGAPPVWAEAGTPPPFAGRDGGPWADTEIPWSRRSRPSCGGADGAPPPWPLALLVLLIRPRRRRR